MTVTALARIAVAAVAAVLLSALAACGPAAGSPNCPPGQWYVDHPGAGWSCTSDPGTAPSIFTPAGSPS